MKKLIEWKNKHWNKIYSTSVELLSAIVMIGACMAVLQGNYPLATVGILIAIYGHLQAKK
ncbi:hypothetical protein PP655_gp051 [Bacillus phage PBC4]|uniref:Uncharacterized protein n=1 Tax=Bacillus phage PBC4 TaxID=1675028 RepID=A0A1D6X897_9CAUD|nr:hypothetical protein PP655_gp051 [Bacillus phage PBC4]AKQ08243.1 hypothetical protein PBC4_051 [Bacillus phage PBC4]